MSAATLGREGGDDRDPEVAEIKKLQEMFDQDSAPEPKSRHMYAPDVPAMSQPELQPGSGDMILQHQVRRTITGQRAGAITLRRVHIRPVQLTWIN